MDGARLELILFLGLFLVIGLALIIDVPRLRRRGWTPYQHRLVDRSSDPVFFRFVLTVYSVAGIFLVVTCGLAIYLVVVMPDGGYFGQGSIFEGLMAPPTPPEERLTLP